MKNYSAIPEVVAVEVLAPYGLRVTFDDGLVRDVDYGPRLAASVGPMFEPLKDPAFFAQAFVADGTVSWPNGADIAPETLHGDFETSSADRQVG